MKLKIPLYPNANQVFSVALNGQYCTITLLQRDNGLYFGLVSNNVKICDNVLCLDRQPVIFTDYRGFAGTLYFQDTQGQTPPAWDGLGGRFELIYEG